MKLDKAGSWETGCLLGLLEIGLGPHHGEKCGGEIWWEDLQLVTQKQPTTVSPEFDAKHRWGRDVTPSTEVDTAKCNTQGCSKSAALTPASAVILDTHLLSILFSVTRMQVMKAKMTQVTPQKAVHCAPVSVMLLVLTTMGI